MCNPPAAWSETVLRRVRLPVEVVVVALPLLASVTLNALLVTDAAPFLILLYLPV